MSAEEKLKRLQEAVKYAVNRLDFDPRGPSQPQVAGDLAVALASTLTKEEYDAWQAARREAIG